MKISTLLLTIFVLSTQTACHGGFSAQQAGLGSNNSLAVNAVASAKVHILDNSGNAVSGATVTGNWSGVVTGQSSATTDANGYATLISEQSNAAGTYTFSVVNIAKAGFTYDSTKNRLTQNSIVK